MSVPLLLKGIRTVPDLQVHRASTEGIPQDEIDDIIESCRLDAPLFPHEDPDNIFEAGPSLTWEDAPRLFTLDDLRRVHQQHERNMKQFVTQDLRIPGMGPLMRIRYSLLDIRNNPNAETFLVCGGGVPSVDSFKVLGFFLAAMGHRVILMPGVLNSDVRPVANEDTFASQYEAIEAENGCFYADGLMNAHMLLHLFQRNMLPKGIRLTGISTGGPVVMRTAQTMFQHYPHAASRIRGLYPINSGGFYPHEVTDNPEARGNAAMMLARGFIREMVSIIPNMEQIIIQMLDAGSPPRSIRYLIQQALRCVSPVVQDVVTCLPEELDATAITVHSSIGDRAISLDQTQRALDEIPSEAPTVSVFTLNGNHATPSSVNVAMQLADLLTSFTQEDL